MPTASVDRVQGDPGQQDHDRAVAAVREHFDRSVASEHDRMVSEPVARVSRELHDRFLRRFVSPGSRVLEIGAGTGRFTETLLRHGARVLVTDLSEAQLAANRDHVTGLGLAAGVEDWQVADVCDLHHLPRDAFDAVLAYGGSLSYAFDRAEDAARGLLRVTRPGGVVVASVMSTLGAFRAFLPGVLDVDRRHGLDAGDRVLSTGDLREVQPPGSGHTCRMFRSDDLRALLERADGRVLAMSASSWASQGGTEARTVLEQLEADPVAWGRHLDREAAAAAAPGALDGGTHLLVAFDAADGR